MPKLFKVKTQNTKRATSFLKAALLFSWDTRIRTRNDRTRICSVTITPYPNVVLQLNNFVSQLRLQRYDFFLNYQNFSALFSKKSQFLSIFPYFSMIFHVFSVSLHLDKPLFRKKTCGIIFVIDKR